MRATGLLKQRNKKKLGSEVHTNSQSVHARQFSTSLSRRDPVKQSNVPIVFGLGAAALLLALSQAAGAEEENERVEESKNNENNENNENNVEIEEKIIEEIEKIVEENNEDFIVSAVEDVKDEKIDVEVDRRAEIILKLESEYSERTLKEFELLDIELDRLIEELKRKYEEQRIMEEEEINQYTANRYLEFQKFINNKIAPINKRSQNIVDRVQSTFGDIYALNFENKSNYGFILATNQYLALVQKRADEWLADHAHWNKTLDDVEAHLDKTTKSIQTLATTIKAKSLLYTVSWKIKERLPFFDEMNRLKAHISLIARYDYENSLIREIPFDLSQSGLPTDSELIHDFLNIISAIERPTKLWNRSTFTNCEDFVKSLNFEEAVKELHSLEDKNLLRHFDFWIQKVQKRNRILSLAEEMI